MEYVSYADSRVGIEKINNLNKHNNLIEKIRNLANSLCSEKLDFSECNHTKACS